VDLRQVSGTVESETHLAAQLSSVKISLEMSVLIDLSCARPHRSSGDSPEVRVGYFLVFQIRTQIGPTQ
jgi:hypothetical protein